MDRLLRGAGGTLELLTYNDQGVLEDVDGANVPTVAVTDAAGITAPGVFTPSKPGATTGTYRCTVPADLQVLDVYDVTWTWAVPNPDQVRSTQFELVGSHLFALAELRASDPDFVSATAYPSDAITRVRTEVEEAFARWARVSFTLLGARKTLSGDGTATLLLPHRRPVTIVSATVDDVVLTTTELGDITPEHTGIVERDADVWGDGTHNVEILYEHGYRTPPGLIKDKAMKYVRSLLTASPFPDRATATLSELGSFRITQAGRDGWTGIPDVDAAIAQFGYAFAVG
jgi:hypothetical protein